MSRGLSARCIADVLFSSVSTPMIDEAKESGELFQFSMKGATGRQNDSVSLYAAKEVLTALIIANGNSTTIDKVILQDGLSLFGSKVGISFKQGTDQGYCIKLMLMQIARMKRNITTGQRLAPWLKFLVDLVDSEPCESTTEYDSDDIRASAGKRMPDSPKTPRRTKAVRSPVHSSAGSSSCRVLVRMPTTPSDRSTPRFLRRSFGRLRYNGGGQHRHSSLVQW